MVAGVACIGVVAVGATGVGETGVGEGVQRRQQRQRRQRQQRLREQRRSRSGWLLDCAHSSACAEMQTPHSKTASTRTLLVHTAESSHLGLIPPHYGLLSASPGCDL